MLDRYRSISGNSLFKYHCSSMLAYLRLHKHQIDKQHHKIMLHIFIRKPLTPRTLCQSDIRTDPSNPSPAFIFRRLLRAHVGLRGAEQVRHGRFGSGCGALVISAVEDVVKLGDWIAAFNADWHAARMLWVTWWSVWWSGTSLVEDLCGIAKNITMWSSVSAALSSRDVGNHRACRVPLNSPSGRYII